MRLSWFYFSLHSPSMFLASLDDCNADVAVLHLSSGQRLSSDFIVTMCDTRPDVVQHFYCWGQEEWECLLTAALVLGSVKARKREKERVCIELLLGTWMRTSFLWKGSVHTLVFSMHGPTLHLHNWQCKWGRDLVSSGLRLSSCLSDTQFHFQTMAELHISFRRMFNAS